MDGQLITGGAGAGAGEPLLPAPRQRIENVVASARLGGPFDVPALARRLKEAEYRPDRFVGLVLRVPKGHGLVFEDGQVVTTGARGVEEALVQMEYVRELLAQTGADTTGVEGFTVRNLVVSAEAGGKLLLDQVRLAFPEEDIEFEPERFPGLVMRLGTPRVTLLAFASGRVVATGSGDMPAVDEALEGFVTAVRERRLLAQPEDETDAERQEAPGARDRHGTRET